ncbi:hypothetical protein WME95_25585 [Sorangium sp. So ce327]|jgi:hypothetical protein|uniref:hypothetical protein n=1 Tax=Sorangium sp. So ce327 TaxID=3133301 RepID=UPI003F606203
MRIIRSAFPLAALFAAGCAVEAADPELMEDAPSLSETWTVSNAADNERWDSGLNANLSAWEYIHCHIDNGAGFMLTDLSAFQEPLTEPDEFIARMSGVCREFDLLLPNLPRTGAIDAETIFSWPGGFRTGALSTAIPVANYPTGLRLKVDGANTYVKDVRINYAPRNAANTALDLAASSHTSYAIGYAGNNVTLNCPAQQVLTGLDLRYDTVEGKIRVLEIHCRALQP